MVNTYPKGLPFNVKRHWIMSSGINLVRQPCNPACIMQAQFIYLKKSLHYLSFHSKRQNGHLKNILNHVVIKYKPTFSLNPISLLMNSPFAIMYLTADFIGVTWYLTLPMLLILHRLWPNLLMVTYVTDW